MKKYFSLLLMITLIMCVSNSSFASGYLPAKDVEQVIIMDDPEPIKVIKQNPIMPKKHVPPPVVVEMRDISEESLDNDEVSDKSEKLIPQVQKAEEYYPGEFIIKLKTVDNSSMQSRMMTSSATPEARIDAIKKKYNIDTSKKLLKAKVKSSGQYFRSSQATANPLDGIYKLTSKKIKKKARLNLTNEDLEDEKLSVGKKMKRILAKLLKKETAEGLEKKARLQYMAMVTGHGLDEETRGMLDKLRSDPNIEWAEINHVVKVARRPSYSLSPETNDGLGSLYGLDLTRTPEAWNTTEGEGIIVGVSDSGVDYTHEDIIDNMWVNPCEIPDNGIDDPCPGELEGNGVIDDVYGYDATGEGDEGDPMDNNGHGTHVAGTIAAVRNNIGVVGVAPKVKIIASKGLNAQGIGGAFESLGSVIYLVNEGVDVINMSWGSSFYSRTAEEIYEWATENDVVLIAASGNADTDTGKINHYPSGYPQVLAVQAIDDEYKRAWFSNYGFYSDVAAPGVGILSLHPPHTSYSTETRSHECDEGVLYCHLNGTSMASPHVAGIAALARASHPEWDELQVRTAIKQNSILFERRHNKKYGHGIVDAKAIVETQNDPMIPIANIVSPNLENDVYVDRYGSFTLVGESTFEGQDNDLRVKNMVTIADVFSGKKAKKVLKGRDSISGEIGNISTRGHQPGLKELTLVTYVGTDYVYDTQRFFLNWNTEVQAKDGFPLQARRPVLGDLDGDGDMEVISMPYTASGESVVISAAHLDGSIVDGFPVSLPETSSMLRKGRSVPSVIDIDNDGVDEIIFYLVGATHQASANYFRNVIGHVYVLDGDGTRYSGWENPFLIEHAKNEAPLLTQDLIEFPSSVVVDDMNGNGNKEIIVSSIGVIHVLKNDKTEYSNKWPVELPKSTNLVAGMDQTDYFTVTHTTPVVADLDKDGLKEIIQVFEEQHRGTGGDCDLLFRRCDTEKIYNVGVYNLDRDENVEWTAQSPVFKTRYEHVKLYASPVVGDINGDGEYEIFVAYEDLDDFQRLQDSYCVSYPSHQIFGYDSRGNLLDGWPVSLDGTEAIVNNMAMGDLNGDGKPELIASHDNLKGGCYGFAWSTTMVALDEHGNLLDGFPSKLKMNTDGFLPAFLIADVVDDGAQEIVFHTDNYGSASKYIGNLFAMKNDGKMDLDFTKHTYRFSADEQGPKILDVDNDGRYDIVAVDSDSVYAWDLKADSSAPEWPQWQHDAGHTGRYGDGLPTMTVTDPPDGAPSSLVASMVGSSGQVGVQLQWQESSSNLQGYHIQRSMTSGFETVYEVTRSSTTPSYIDNDVVFDNQYYYRIKGFNSLGETSYSNVVSINVSSGSFAVTVASVSAEWELDATTTNTINAQLSNFGPLEVESVTHWQIIEQNGISKSVGSRLLRCSGSSSFVIPIGSCNAVVPEGKPSSAFFVPGPAKVKLNFRPKDGDLVVIERNIMLVENGDNSLSTIIEESEDENSIPKITITKDYDGKKKIVLVGFNLLGVDEEDGEDLSYEIQVNEGGWVEASNYVPLDSLTNTKKGRFNKLEARAIDSDGMKSKIASKLFKAKN